MKRHSTFRLPVLGFAVLLGLYLPPTEAQASAQVWSNTNAWFEVPHTLNQSYVFDHAKDAQTGDPRAELVGDSNNPGFYFAYDSDTNGGLNADGRLLFRVRVAAWHATGSNPPTNNPGQYGSSLFVGIDGNGDGAIDIFVVADDRGSAASRGVKLYYPSCPSGSTSCYTGPSNTNLGSQTGSNVLFSSTGTKPNFNWVQVNSTTDPRTGSEPPLNDNIVAGTEGKNSSYQNIDGFFSFAVDLASISTALANKPANERILNFGSSSTMRFLVVTAQQTNSFNQDTGGCNNNTGFANWADCAFSDPMRPIDYVPTPEPSTSGVAVLSLGGILFARRRFRHRG